MKIASLADVKAKFSAYVNASADGPVVVTRNGKPVAMLLAVNDEEELERLMIAHSPRVRKILDAAQNRIQAGKGIPHDEFWRQVARDTRGRNKGTSRSASKKRGKTEGRKSARSDVS